MRLVNRLIINQKAKGGDLKMETDAMVELAGTANRIAYDDLFDTYDGKYVILGYCEEDEWGNVISGIPIEVIDGNVDGSELLDLYFKYTEENKHGKLCYNYFGNVETIGVYL